MRWNLEAARFRRPTKLPGGAARDSLGGEVAPPLPLITLVTGEGGAVVAGDGSGEGAKSVRPGRESTPGLDTCACA